MREKAINRRGFESKTFARIARWYKRLRIEMLRQTGSRRKKCEGPELGEKWIIIEINKCN